MNLRALETVKYFLFYLFFGFLFGSLFEGVASSLKLVLENGFLAFGLLFFFGFLIFALAVFLIDFEDDKSDGSGVDECEGEKS